MGQQAFGSIGDRRRLAREVQAARTAGSTSARDGEATFYRAGRAAAGGSPRTITGHAGTV